MAAMELPSIPVPVSEFIEHVNKHPTNQAGVAKAVEPFKNFENKLREIYAQQPEHAATTQNHLVSIFDHDTLTIRAREPAKESPAEKDAYLLPLHENDRRKQDSPATVQSLKEFRTNLNIFSESSLADLDWSNVICAGSAVVTSLLPVDHPHNESKRTLRTYYHETLAPASDVDLFLYGLNEEQAIAKVKQIETKIRDSILAETTTVRTKNAITIVSQYPIRHVQIVLRLYKTVSEILAGFDVDCSCVAYDGHRVWASPRALAAFMTQVNTVDLTRRSPSYENRLSKYSHRGFEVCWPTIERSRIDPTIFERSFSRVQGLARLLVLEKLPHPDDRDSYLAKRRAERGRPALSWNARSQHQLPGNVKDAQPDDVAEWVEEDEVSNYHTITIPYGPKYSAKKVEKLLFTKDLLLNAEWNKPKDRETKLHRHPAFFGSVDDVLQDCCGFCPEPVSDADLAALEEEGKIYISGEVTFLKDNPGRQAIGSFNPISDDDWTEMAYVGNTTRLCQAIVDLDLEAVSDWFSSSQIVDVNRRDHAGRTPLQLAVMCSTPEIVRCLIEHNARLVSRLYNGMTALHLAAHRGATQMVKDILDRSEANAEEEAEKEGARKEARRLATPAKTVAETTRDDDKDEATSDASLDSDDDDDDDFDGIGDEDADALTEGSFVKVQGDSNMEDADDKDEPDVYDVDVLAWDSPLSPLHLAILAGHLEVIDLLVSKYAADALLPVKVVDENNRKYVRGVILTIRLAMELPLQEANETVKSLLGLGVPFTQADDKHITGLHHAVHLAKTVILRTMESFNPSTCASACNFLAVSGYHGRPQVQVPLFSAILTGRLELVQWLLGLGAKPSIDFESFAQAYKRVFEDGSNDPQEVKKVFNKFVEQPIFVALEQEMLEVVLLLITAGVDANSLPMTTYQFLENIHNGSNKSLLDLVQDRIKVLKEYLDPKNDKLEEPAPFDDDSKYLNGFPEGSYRHWTATHDLRDAKAVHNRQLEQYQQTLVSKRDSEHEAAKRAAVQDSISQLHAIERELLEKGAKPFTELYPDKKPEDSRPNFGYYHRSNYFDNEPYRTRISFHTADLTPEKEAKYIELFEAAWRGDTDTVKSLCLHGENPISVAVSDLRGFSPFSLAMIRGHLATAEVAVDITKAQYQPHKKADRYQYTLALDDNDLGDDDDVENGGAAEQSGKVKISAQLVNDDFTLADIATLADNVKSRVSPSQLVAWNAQVGRALSGESDEKIEKVFGGISQDQHFYIGDHSKQSWAWFNAVYNVTSNSTRWSLTRLAIFTGNMALLKFLIKLGNDLAFRGDDGELVHVSQFPRIDFDLAVKMGRVEMIGEIIKSTGFGFPLQQAFEKSGIKLEEKPRYYQGLTVHGRKREDWAQAGRNEDQYGTRQSESDLGVPLLSVAKFGNLETTDYFMSDAPLRRYLEFAEDYKDDKRIRGLAQTDIGINGTLESWLATRNELALPVAVLSPPKRDGSQPILDFFVERTPGALEVRAANGKTPLHLAVQLSRWHAVKKLIAAGADQTTKDNMARNLMHTLMASVPTDKTALLASVIGLFDKDIVRCLLLERSSSVNGTGETPLAEVLGRIHEWIGWEESLKLILSLSDGKDLEQMNGAGDYPLHNVVRDGKREVAKFIVNYRPGLLYWENATGMTVIDVVTTTYLQRQITEPNLNWPYKQSVKDKPASDFAKEQKAEGKSEELEDITGRNDQWHMYRLITSLAAKYPAKRKLVTLHDANEVAKRLALQQQRQNNATQQGHRFGLPTKRMGLGDNPDRVCEDEVSEYLNSAMRWTKWDEMVWRKTELGEKDIEDGYTTDEP